MARRSWSFGSAQTWFALAFVATFVYGVEHWRRRTSARATRGEQARFHAVVTCLVGADGAALTRSPSELRRRLRLLAMDTPIDPAPTWVDRCIPLLRDLAVHGAEVDVTRDPRSAPTAVGRHARELALAVARVGAVWQVRAGDPDADMDDVADLLVRTATEIDLAGFEPSRESLKGPRAPPVRPLPVMARLATSGLLPLPVGGVERFLVGAPLPYLSVVDLRRGAPAAEVLANDDARWWRVVPLGVVRVMPDDGAPDALAPVTFDAPGGRSGAARIAAPPTTLDPRAVSLDAITRGDVLWLAQSVRGRGTVLARLPTGARARSAATAARLSTPSGERVDEEVAVGAEASGVVAAYTEHLPSAGVVDVRVVRAVGGERAEVRRVEGDPWQLRGRRPGLAFCTAQGTTWLFAASHDEWRGGVLRGGALVEAGRIARGGGARFDESLTVRCGAFGVLVYGRERARVSPVWRCATPPAPGELPSCVALPPVPSPQPGGLAYWVTPTARGERRVHPEWPLVFALTGDGTVIAARAAGTIVAVTRLPYGASQWEPERVVLDAALDEPHATVQGVELYSDGGRVTLAATTDSELRAALSDDRGATWRAP